MVGQPQGVGDPGWSRPTRSTGRAPAAVARRAMSLARFQFTAPSWGCIIACIWPISAERSGMPRRAIPGSTAGATAAPAAERGEELLEGRALERVGLVAGVVRSWTPNYSVGPSTGGLARRWR